MNRFFRSTSAPPQRPLTAAQERSLVALAVLCPGLGEEAAAGQVAQTSGIKPGATTLALRGLERRRLVTGHGHDSEPRMWAPTLTGRALAKHLRGTVEEPRVERDDAREEPVQPDDARDERADDGGAPS